MASLHSHVFRIWQLVFKSRVHLLEMLEDRGYDITSVKNYTGDEIKVMLDGHITGKFGTLSEKGPLDILLEKNTGTSNAEKIYVKYRLD